MKRIKLSSEQIQDVRVEKAEARWEVDRAGKAVFSTKCECHVSSGTVCGECAELREIPSFQHALSRPIPEPLNFKHTPNTLFRLIPFMSYLLIK